jgi:glutaredoxin
MPVIVYSKNSCPACSQAKVLLDTKGVAYDVKMVDRDMDAMDFMVEQGHRSMPQIYKDGALAVEGGYLGLTKLTDEQWAKLK